MKKVSILILFIVMNFSITLAPCVYANTLSFSDNPDAIQSASNSVVKLNCYDRYGNLYASGSAFAAFDEDVFVTNYHVIDEETFSIIVQTETGEEFNISTIVAHDQNSDIAIIQSGESTGVTLLTLGCSDSLGKGEKVTTIGSPLGLINTVSVGIYSGIVEDGQKFLQFSAPISAGSSGGALFNDNGEVVGITSASFEKGQNLNLAIPIENVIELWNNHFESTSVSLQKFYNIHEHIVTIDRLYSDINYFLSPDAPKKVTVEGYIAKIDSAKNEITLIGSNDDTIGSTDGVVIKNVNALIAAGLSLGEHVKANGKIESAVGDSPIYINGKTSLITPIE